MPVNVFITIDVEEDQWGAYHETNPPVNNVSRIPIIQAIFNQFGAIPTYLVNYPVVKNDSASETLLDIFNKGQCEIGTHCHPWNTPPFDEDINLNNTMLCNLPYKILRCKIEALHNLISDSFGIIPKSFRAGRFGFGPVVARCIHELGYQVDTSVTPFNDWTDLGGPDFWNAPYSPYRFDPVNVLSEKRNGCLLEIPITVGFFQNNLKLSSRILKSISIPSLSRFRIVPILDKLRIINRRWLSPESTRGHEMILLAKSLIRNGCSYLNMAFHSTSILPGNSPFVRDEQEFQRFLSDIEVFLQFAKEQEMRFLPLQRALEVFDGKERRTDPGI